jgi:hypothetical protein
MTERSSEEKPMPTIWCVPDELWETIEPILAEHHLPRRTERLRTGRRAVLNGIISRLGTSVESDAQVGEPHNGSSVIGSSSGGLSSGARPDPGGTV